MRDVVRIAKSGLAPILMCACADYNACHRKVAAEKVAAALGGVDVVNLVHQPKPPKPNPQASLGW